MEKRKYWQIKLLGAQTINYHFLLRRKDRNTHLSHRGEQGHRPGWGWGQGGGRDGLTQTPAWSPNRLSAEPHRERPRARWRLIARKSDLLSI